VWRYALLLLLMVGVFGISDHADAVPPAVPMVESIDTVVIGAPGMSIERNRCRGMRC
jgi:hypothetical protein